MPITRRAALSTVPLAMAATSLSGSAFAQAPNPARAPQAPRVPRQAPGFYRYKVGDVEVTAINDGISLPLEGLVRNAESQRSRRPREAFLPERLPHHLHDARHPKRRKATLIDTGNGDSARRPPEPGWRISAPPASIREVATSSSAISTATISTGSA